MLVHLPQSPTTADIDALIAAVSSEEPKTKAEKRFYQRKLLQLQAARDVIPFVSEAC